MMRFTLTFVLLAGLALGGWMPEERITNRTTQSDRTSPNNARCIACDSAGNVHAVWYGDSGGTSQVWYSRRDAATGQWSAGTTLSAGQDDATSPSVSADPLGNVHVAWQVSTTVAAICYRMRTVAGGWGAVETVWRGSGAAEPGVVGFDSATAAAVWTGNWLPSRQNILSASRVSAGWSAASLVSIDDGSSQGSAAIAQFETAGVVVAWRRASPGQILSRRLVAGQLSPLDTVYGSGSCGSVSVASGGDSSYWCSWAVPYTGPDSLLCRQWRNGAWEATRRLVPAGTDPVPASAAVAPGGRLHCAWCQPGYQNRNQVLYSSADSVAGPWAIADTLTTSSNDRDRAHTAADAASMNVLWTDYRNNQTRPDIYFRRWEFVRDVAVLGFEALPDTVDSGAAVVPMVRVANLGDTVELNVPVWLSAPGVSLDTVLDSIAKGATATVMFDTLRLLRRGSVVLTCSTYVDGDDVDTNDVRRDTVFVAVRDVAVESIFAPRDTVYEDSVAPVVQLANHGNLTARCTCAVTIRRDTALVYSERLPLLLGADSSRTVVMPVWRCLPGRYTLSAVVRLGGDMVSENDSQAVEFWVPRHDVGIDSILAPVGRLDSGRVVAPKVRVFSAGEVAETAAVSLRIGTSAPAESLTVTFQPGETLIVTFPNRPLLDRGPHPVVCAASVHVDHDPSNNVAVETVFVRVVDAVARSIEVPGEVIGPGELSPQATLANLGTQAETVQCVFSIRAGGSLVYSDTLVQEVSAGSDTSVVFREWTTQSGSYRAVFSVSAEDEMRPENDTVEVAFRVVALDAAAMAIEAPTGTIREGDVHPAVRIRNCGEDTVEVWSVMVIQDGGTVRYSDSAQVTGLAPAQETVAVLPVWQATRGEYAVRSWVVLVDDENPANDSLSGNVVVESTAVVVDAAALQILAPAGSIPEGQVRPLVRIANLGDDTANIWTVMAIQAGGVESYRDDTLTLVAPGETADVVLPVWQARHGQYTVSAWVVLEGDRDHSNDSLFGNVVVESTVVARWHQLADIPAGPRNVPVLDGGALVAAGGRLFALKGGTRELWRYSPPDSLWTACADLPGGRKTGGGAALAWDGANLLYATRGRGSGELFCYDIIGDTWTACEALPAFVRAFRHGAALAYAAGDTAKVFAVKGSNTLDLLSYLPARGQWHSRRPMPAGPLRRKARKGTCLASAGGRLFCLKGGTAEFFEYFPRRDSWAGRADLPRGSRSGRSRPSGDGAAVAWDGAGSLYMAKGRGLEFWRYSIAGDTWEQLDDVPQSIPRRPCRKGTALAAFGGSVYLLRGNATREFWRYDPAAASRRPERVGLTDEVTVTRSNGMQSLSIGGALPAGWRCYDAAGRRVGPGARRCIVFAVGPGGSVKRVSPLARP
jgi:hypothetical protein